MSKDKSKREEAQRFVAQNRRARHDYMIVDTCEAGMILTGTEVKSLRMGTATLQQAHAGLKQGRIWLFNMTIPEYGKAGVHLQHDPLRPRELLLKKRQVDKFLGAVKKDGMTLVPLSIYFNARGIAKLELALAKGKHKADKRASEKERDWQRDKGRLMREKG